DAHPRKRRDLVPIDFTLARCSSSRDDRGSDSVGWASEPRFSKWSRRTPLKGEGVGVLHEHRAVVDQRKHRIEPTPVRIQAFVVDDPEVVAFAQVVSKTHVRREDIPKAV